MIDWEEMEEMFIIMIESTDYTRYRREIPSWKWSQPLIVNGKKIDSISWDGDNFNMTWYDVYEEPQPLEYYKRDIVIQPNKNLFIYLFGDS